MQSSMPSSATRARALTAPIVQNTPALDLIRSPTNYSRRDRHAVPPSILAQNRELLGIAEAPRVLTCNEEQHVCVDPIRSDSTESDHVELGEITTVATLPTLTARRRSTLAKLSETARKTGRNAKRKLSKVISWKGRRDSGKDGETTSPLNKVSKTNDSGDVEAIGPRATSLGDGHSCVDPAWEEAMESSSHGLEKNSQSPPEYEPPPFRLELPILDNTFASPEDWQPSPQTYMQMSVDYYNRHCQASPDEMPHDCFMDDPWLWEGSRKRLQFLVENPDLVAMRFDEIYREML